MNQEKNREKNIEKNKKKIGLVLSGGGMHGFAQIGALKVLEEKGIKPDIIIGSSVGSLVGAAMAAGISMEDIEKAVLNTNLFKLIQPTLGQGLVKGERISKFVLNTIKVKNFEDLKTKLIVNAANITKGKEVVFEKGPLLPALTASISVPGIFAPVNHEEGILVDGGFYDIIPMHHAREMDIIIIIDISYFDYKINSKSNILNILQQSIVNLQQRVIELNTEKHDKTHKLIVIQPDVSKYSLFEYKKAKQKDMVKIGEAEARKVLSEAKTKKILGI